MTLDEAIIHCEEVADGHDRIKQIKAVTLEECKCASEHRQLAEWLRELKAYKEQTDGDLISRQAVIDSLYELCDTGESLKENPWRDNPHIDALVETIEEIPSAEKTDSFIPQEDVAGILNTVESALKGTNYEVVGYDNTYGFLKVLIDVK